ncbi:hypothetical protein PGTUg99_002876 [Puccinia graminis f. sp. tritici]|uniref:Uncharacterized protein n=1 Tax=Puccinia graminis f. sp. tritici TaxID=56615 RepID=A0A5B0RJL5_PUCGR|nr:hypothetical protein PGTUg99_002876 [Puccinia graminis f. sp. tritici]
MACACNQRRSNKSEVEAKDSPSHLLQAIPCPHPQAIKRGPIMRGQLIQLSQLLDPQSAQVSSQNQLSQLSDPAQSALRPSSSSSSSS